MCADLCCPAQWTLSYLLYCFPCVWGCTVLCNIYRNVDFMSVWVCFWQEKETFEPYSTNFLLIVLAASLWRVGGWWYFLLNILTNPEKKKTSPSPYWESSIVKRDNELENLQLQVLCKEEILERIIFFCSVLIIASTSGASDCWAVRDGRLHSGPHSICNSLNCRCLFTRTVWSH